MTADDRETTYGSQTPEAAFQLLGNEIRAGILRALSDERGGFGNPPALSFSELRDRVAPDCDSSKFNYHLQQLVGQLVERRDDEDAQLVDDFADDECGYALRPDGTLLTRTIRAGTTTGDASFGPVESGLDCYFCGASVEATYRNAICKLQCPDCEYLYEYNLTPPGVLEADDERAVLSQVAEYNRHVRLGFARGVCPLCASGVDTRFVRPAELGYPRADRRDVLVNRSCVHCGNMDYLTVGEALLRDAHLVSFCAERGLDVTTTPIWDLEFAATDRHTTVRSADPWTVALAVQLDGDVLELVVDGDLRVVDRTVR